ncbi:MAG: FAD-dependent oxidoreductase [Chitinophagaceae bacterium]|nr:FAD-dependent oxidoreductase [Chitinophagaceae bacterium]
MATNHLSRREFLRNSALATGALLLSGTTLSSFSVSKKITVIVMGAGFAGLSAANQLKKKGYNVIVLEAKGRIGGRVFSTPIQDNSPLIVELGAEWVGDSHTRIKELCGEFGLKLNNNQFDSDLIYRDEYFTTGRWKYSDEWEVKFNKILKDFHQFSQDDKEKLDRMDWWRFLVNNGCEGRDLEIRELLDSTDFGETIRHVSAFAALAEYAESSPKNEMDFKIEGGNSQLAHKFADAIGRENIHLKHAVTKVIQPRKGKVTVECSNGKTFQADKIICTLPTFAVSKVIWEPGLESKYIAAINELQYARINKNPVLFNDRFWKREDFDMVTDRVPHYFYHATKNQQHEKGVLLSYTIGDKAAVVAAQTDEWRAKQIDETLAKAFGPVKDKIEGQLNYFWGSDEYSRGAYAIYGKGQWFRVMPILKRPHVNTFFAGEHLADWQGFMEGAINSGEEMAEKV